MSKIQFHDGLRKRNIGTFNESTNTFSKVVDRRKHLFKKLNAWGIDAKYLNDVLLPNDSLIVVYDRFKEITYKVTASKMRERGVFYHFDDGTEDNGAQIFLPITEWDAIDNYHTNLIKAIV